MIKNKCIAGKRCRQEIKRNMNKPCSLHCFLSIVIVGLFAQGQALKADENSITVLKTIQKEDSNASNQIIQDTAISYQSQSCVLDSAKFS